MFDAGVFETLRNGVRMINVSRGPIIDETALIEALECGKVYSVALDVYEEEPLPLNSYMRTHEHCVLGSHNSSNTADAVRRTSRYAIEKLGELLNL